LWAVAVCGGNVGRNCHNSLLAAFFKNTINNTFNMKDKDIKHLKWVYERMKYVHNEKEEHDYMIRFREILEALPQPTLISGSGKLMEEQFEKLGQLIDSLDNLAHALKLPLPPAMHVQSLSNILPEKVSEFKKVFTEITGNNPWE
jgi:hypothetical protein